MKTQIKVSLLLLVGLFISVNSFGQIPYVYNLENTGASITRSATTMPVLANCPIIAPLPDPFAWSADPLGVNPVRSTAFSDWEKHRQEILDMIQNYEIGIKPVVNKTTHVTATYSGTTLTVTTAVDGKTLTQTATVTLPTTGTAPYPIVIGMNSANGSLPAAMFSSRGIATINFAHNQVTTYNGFKNTDPFFTLYPAQNVDNTGQYAAWSWGVSRLIDGLEKVQATLPIDLSRIAVTGCSYAGKMALFAGAFDERIALTVAQESGGGGATSWRYSATQSGVEGLAQTNQGWFKNGMFDFGGDNVSKIPTDHHMLNALVAPRALMVTGNTDYVWLSNKSNFVNCKATKRIYETLGIGDRFAYVIDGGHPHCAIAASQETQLAYMLDKFMKGNTTLSQQYEVFPAPYSTIDYGSWTNWWGTSNPVFPVERKL